MSKDPFDIKMPKIKQPVIKPIRIKQPKIIGFGKASSREPLPAKKKNAVRERAKNTCEYRGCKHKENLQFHHKNMKNSDNRISNIELLCPNHHMKRHSEKFRKNVSEDWLTGEKKTRLVKKPKKKTTKKTTTKKRTNKNDQFGFPKVKMPKPPKWKF